MLREAHYEVVDFGDSQLKPDDDYPDFVVPLARAVARGEVDRGVAICGSGVGACIAANKVRDVRACLIHESFSAHQGVEDDDMNVICLERNGRHVTFQGTHANYQTGPIYWGEPGTNGQHSFYQLIHQGTKLIPCDFIGFVHALNPLGNHHDLLLANVFAQAEALRVRPDARRSQVRRVHRSGWCRTARSRATAVDTSWPSGYAETLGKLIALYEHSVFTQGTIWQIDSFDQWGVELGKVLAERIIPELGEPEATADEQPLKHDSSTNALIRHYRSRRTMNANFEVLRERGLHGTGHDRTGPDGNQHGAASYAGRPPVRRLRPPSGSRAGTRQRRSGRDDIARRLREEAEIASHRLDDGAGGRGRSDAEDPRPAPRT